jgi:hypothetical protein
MLEEVSNFENTSVPKGLMDNIRHNFKSSTVKLNFKKELRNIFTTPSNQKPAHKHNLA